MTQADGAASPPQYVTIADSSITPSWRYLGERDEADVAYCVRFGVQEAPEPTKAANGVWSYTLPATTSRIRAR